MEPEREYIVEEKEMKIGVRLVVIISIVNLIGIGLLAGITLILSQREIGRLAGEQAQSIAREDGEKISKWFEEYIGATRTLAQIMEGYQDISKINKGRGGSHSGFFG
jgi:hypothetical protein